MEEGRSGEGEGEGEGGEGEGEGGPEEGGGETGRGKRGDRERETKKEGERRRSLAMVGKERMKRAMPCRAAVLQRFVLTVHYCETLFFFFLFPPWSRSPGLRDRYIYVLVVSHSKSE